TFAYYNLLVSISKYLNTYRHTPKSFANFGIVMKFHVVSDLQTIISAAAGMNRTVTIDNAFVYIAYGPCKWVSSSVCFLSYGLMTMGGSMTLYLVLVSFIVRLQIMRNRKPSDRSIIILLSMLSFPVPTAIFVRGPFICLYHVQVLYLSSRSEDSTMRAILEAHLPEYATPDMMIFGLNDSATFLSERTKTMHSQFVKVLFSAFFLLENISGSLNSFRYSKRSSER
ncbi:hypothetical protein PENTCL1PPCAC_15159, partial [Pristionchus entomophagus]